MKGKLQGNDSLHFSSYLDFILFYFFEKLMLDFIRIKLFLSCFVSLSIIKTRSSDFNLIQLQLVFFFYLFLFSLLEGTI